MTERESIVKSSVEITFVGVDFPVVNSAQMLKQRTDTFCRHDTDLISEDDHLISVNYLFVCFSYALTDHKTDPLQIQSIHITFNADENFFLKFEPRYDLDIK